MCLFQYRGTEFCTRSYVNKKTRMKSETVCKRRYFLIASNFSSISSKIYIRSLYFCASVRVSIKVRCSGCCPIRWWWASDIWFPIRIVIMSHISLWRFRSEFSVVRVIVFWLSLRWCLNRYGSDPFWFPASALLMTPNIWYHQHPRQEQQNESDDTQAKRISSVIVVGNLCQPYNHGYNSKRNCNNVNLYIKIKSMIKVVQMTSNEILSFEPAG